MLTMLNAEIYYLKKLLNDKKKFILIFKLIISMLIVEQPLATT